MTIVRLVFPVAVFYVFIHPWGEPRAPRSPQNATVYMVFPGYVSYAYARLRVDFWDDVFG